MRRVAPIACLMAVLALPGSASATGSVVGSGNFHVPGKVIGCHYVEYGPVSAALPASATIRCERYSDRTFVAISTTGTVTKSHQGSTVAPGPVAHQGGWTHRFSAKLTCTAIGMVGGGGEVDCTFGARHSFRINPTLVRITN
jgi:hypothetical protein